MLDHALGSSTPQTAKLADNVAAGAANKGYGPLYQDLKAGNYGSALGNAVHMGQDNANRDNANLSSMPPAQAPQVPQPALPPGPYQPQLAETPFLQQMKQRYMR
ncbi:hypothetical protein GMST_32750 [Geomonas silvestris]|uniref:Uncharacterized protein n=1 Tax=Geomonas silvestris TaxID=2740184 RepID=A0A6V8MLP4_9BACT|nr:hypothetical protein GMST_32750 [Geomonas silvestris]